VNRVEDRADPPIRFYRVIAVLTAAVLLLPFAAGATGTHNMLRAALIYGPQSPRMGDIWYVSATLESTDGLVHPSRRVKLIADMTVHAMRPVEADMTRTDSAGRTFSGQLSFTMPGPWRVTLRSDDVNELLIGSFPFDVANDDEPRGATEMRTVVYLTPPPQANLVPPILAVVVTIALALAFEIAAAVYQRRRTTREICSFEDVRI
jgi:hypothetical protein